MVLEVGEDTRVDEQRRLDAIGRRRREQLQLVDQPAQQRFGIARLADDVTHLPLDLRRLGERAQLQADDGALDPGARLGEGGIGHG